jgi:hypothetical protein
MAIQNLIQSIIDKEMNWEYLIKIEKQLKIGFQTRKVPSQMKLHSKILRTSKGCMI